MGGVAAADHAFGRKLIGALLAGQGFDHTNYTAAAVITAPAGLGIWLVLGLLMRGAARMMVPAA